MVDGAAGKMLKLKVNAALLEQMEVPRRHYLAAGTPVEQIPVLKSSNKPDFTFYQWHPQAKYRFNRNCNMITDAAAAAATSPSDERVAYMGDNNYVLSGDLFAKVKTAVLALA